MPTFEGWFDNTVFHITSYFQGRCDTFKSATFCLRRFLFVMGLFTGFAQLDLTCSSDDKTTYLKVTQLNDNIFFPSIRSSYWFSSAYNFFRCSFRFYLISCFSTNFLFSRILIERRLQLLQLFITF